MKLLSSGDERLDDRRGGSSWRVKIYNGFPGFLSFLEVLAIDKGIVILKLDWLMGRKVLAILGVRWVVLLHIFVCDLLLNYKLLLNEVRIH